jgi:hypothetical protein
MVGPVDAGRGAHFNEGLCSLSSTKANAGACQLNLP